MAPRTLAEKVWDQRVVVPGGGEGGAREPDLIYIDLHLVHEVTSPQAFDGLRLAGRELRRPDLTIATEDHNVPTADIFAPIADLVSRTQVDTLRRNCEEFGVRLYPMGDLDQGIVHIIGPQLGLTQPGMTIVCGDSHTSTHGAFGSIAMGIGTSEVEHVMATQTLSLRPFKTMAITVDGELAPGVTSKDLILATNTSSLSITKMAADLKHPERVVGFHFFNPVAVLPLLEVVKGEKTDDATLATAFATAKTLKKSAVLSADLPGFVFNRLVTRASNEIISAIDEGTPFDVADGAVGELGMPMSPLTLLALVGPAVALHT
ncbi:hypothetical protein JTZ10_23735, partial [Gordonia rubripertincta]